MADLAKLVDELSALTVMEAADLSKMLEEKWGGRIDFTDYLLLMKMDGEWKCVAKAYNQNSNTVRK